MKISELFESVERPEVLTDQDAIRTWLSLNSNLKNWKSWNNIKWGPNNEINLPDDTVVIRLKRDDIIRVKFGEVESFDISGTAPRVWSFPTYCSISLSLYNLKLDSFEGIEFPKIGGTLAIGGNKITDLSTLKVDAIGSLALYSSKKLTTLKGIHNSIKQFFNTSGVITIDECHKIKDGLLDAMRIPGFKHITYSSPQNQDLAAAVRIINKHVGKGKAGILEAQSELSDADLESFE